MQSEGSIAWYLLQILVSAFLGILFLQSGIDKIVDRQGNLSWLSGHFAKSPLAGFVPLLFGILTVIEVSAGALSGIGFLALIFSHNPGIAFYGALVSAVAILFLFFGQRIAKEYAGAAVLVPYFLLTLIAIYLLAQ
jgi:diacylglycerol kinase